MQFSARKARTLRQAWFGPLSAEEIAKRHRCASAQALRNFWKREKIAGRLPTDQARPHFEDQTTIPRRAAITIDPVDVEFDDPSGDVVDHAPAVPANDPLLSALRGVHGRERIRGINDEMPSHLLMIEAGDEYQRYTPSRSRVVDFQRGRDAYVAARMVEKPLRSNVRYARVGRAWWLLAGMEMVAGPFLAFVAAQDHVREHGAFHRGKSA